MQPIPIDTESFELMRTAKEPMLYVDKTAYFHRLITDPQSRNFFLARPRRFGKSLMISTLDAFFLGLKALYAAATYGSTEGRVHESYYSRNLLFFLLKGQGIICQPEVQQTDGRADLVADHVCGTYIFELKVDKPAALATTQAERQHDAEPYRAADKPVWVIGLAFDSRTHELADHCVERFA